MRSRIAIGAALALLWAGGAMAEEATVQDLRNKCQLVSRIVNNGKQANTRRDLLDATYCLGFMTGMGFTMQLNCIDPDYQGPMATMKGTTGQRVQAFLNWADAHPELWGESEVFAARALAETLPCDRSK